MNFFGGGFLGYFLNFFVGFIFWKRVGFVVAKNIDFFWIFLNFLVKVYIIMGLAIRRNSREKIP